MTYTDVFEEFLLEQGTTPGGLIHDDKNITKTCEPYLAYDEFT